MNGTLHPSLAKNLTQCFCGVSRMDLQDVIIQASQAVEKDCENIKWMLDLLERTRSSGAPLTELDFPLPTTPVEHPGSKKMEWDLTKLQ